MSNKFILISVSSFDDDTVKEHTVLTSLDSKSIKSIISNIMLLSYNDEFRQKVDFSSILKDMNDSLTCTVEVEKTISFYANCDTDYFDKINDYFRRCKCIMMFNSSFDESDTFYVVEV